MNPDPESRPVPPDAVRREIQSLVLMYGLKKVIEFVYRQGTVELAAARPGEKKSRIHRACNSLYTALSSLVDGE